MEGGRRGQRSGEEKGKRSGGMVQVRAGLSCGVGLRKDKAVKPLSTRSPLLVVFPDF